MTYAIAGAGAGGLRRGSPGCGIKSLVRGLKPVLFIIMFTGVLNLFFTPGTAVSGGVGARCISPMQGLRNAVFMVLRIMLLIMGTFLHDLYHQSHQPDRRTGAAAGTG